VTHLFNFLACSTCTACTNFDDVPNGQAVVNRGVIKKGHYLGVGCPGSTGSEGEPDKHHELVHTQHKLSCQSVPPVLVPEGTQATPKTSEAEPGALGQTGVHA
jgi:hypothetical protein